MAKKKRDRNGRDAEGFASTLPIFIVSAGEKPGTLNVECPRGDCGGKFIVGKKRWQEGNKTERTHIGRSCPYCFRTGRMPLKYMSDQTKRDWCLGEYSI